MSKEIIFQSKGFRIAEVLDDTYSLEFLKGDVYKPELHPQLEAGTLLKEEKLFEKLVENEGVFGYVLEKWNPAIGKGWEHQDSCWGFVGRYCDHNHYIVDEFKAQIK